MSEDSIQTDSGADAPVGEVNRADEERLNAAINAVTEVCKSFPVGSTPRSLLYGQRAKIARAVVDALDASAPHLFETSLRWETRK